MGLSRAFIVLAAVACLLLEANADPKMKEIKKWKKKIAHHHFMCKCWGEKSMMNFYEKIHGACEECQTMDPAFPINIFEEDEDMNLNEIVSESDELNPFVVSPQGFGTLPALANSPTRFQQQNPLQAWMQLWAPYLPPQAQANFRYPQAARAWNYRNKRAVDPPTKEELQEFAQDVAAFKVMKKAMIGNLTCVLSKLGALDANLNINLNHFTTEKWGMFARGEQPEPAFKAKMIQGYQNCYQLAQKLPTDVLAQKGPFYQQFGRQMMFFKCAKMMTTETCVKKELLNWVDYLYGKPTAQMREKLGLPSDEYDAAFMSFVVMDKSEEPSEKFVHQFMFGNME